MWHLLRFGRLTDEDLAAIHAFLPTIRPVAHAISTLASPTWCAVCEKEHGLEEVNEIEISEAVRIDFIAHVVLADGPVGFYGEGGLQASPCASSRATDERPADVGEQCSRVQAAAGSLRGASASPRPRRRPQLELAGPRPPGHVAALTEGPFPRRHRARGGTMIGSGLRFREEDSPPSLRMNRLALLLSLVVAAPAYSQTGWAAIDVGTTEDILAISPQLDQTLMIVGTNGFAARASTILINQWNEVDLGTTEDVLSIVRHGSRGFWVSGRNGVMRHSDDRGATWQDKDLPDLTQSYVLTSAPGNGVFAFGSSGSAYASSSPTGSWQTRETGITSALHSLDRYPSTVIPFGLAVGDGGTLLSVDERGTVWTPKSSGTTENLHDILRVSDTDWLIVGGGGLILRSSDGGETWSPRTSGTTATLYGLAGSISEQRVLAVGENGTALESTNAGETWAPRGTGTDATLYAAFLRGAGNWLVAGAGGTLLQASVGVASEPGVSDVGYVISEVSPNPVVEHAAISLSIDRPQRVAAELVNGLGRRVRVLHTGWMAAGEAHTLRIEASGLAPGLYVVHVQGETFADTRRMTVMR